MAGFTERILSGFRHGVKVVAWMLMGGFLLGIGIIVLAFATAGPYSGPNADALIMGGFIAGLSLFGFLMAGFAKNTSDNALEQQRAAYWQKRRQIEAERAEAGEKPVGEPWATTLGGAFFMAPQQIRDSGHGFDAVRHDIPVLGGVGEGDKQGQLTRLTFIHHNAPSHLLTVAPTRSGKGVSAVIPNLLTYRGSVIVNDVKGENFNITARRRHEMGHRVIKFAPFSEDSDCWNPMAFVATEGDEAREDAELLAELLLVPTGGAEAQYFEDRARNFLRAVILHVATTRTIGEGRSLALVRELLTLPRSEFNALLDEMAESSHQPVRRAANLLREAEEKHIEQIMSTLDSQMAIWDSERLTAVMGGESDFALADAKLGNVSIFFQLPPDKLNRYKPLLRVFFGMAIREMTRVSKKPEPPVLFMLDEFPALGRMQSIEEAIPYLAGYGVRLWLFAQDLGQIRKAYGAGADTVLANCGCWQFFGVQDTNTARLVSEMTGQTTVSTVSRSADAGWASENTPLQQSVSQTARPLMTTDEVVAMEDPWQLVFINGIRPVRCEKLRYYALEMFEGLHDPPDAMPMEGRVRPASHRRVTSQVRTETQSATPRVPQDTAQEPSASINVTPENTRTEEGETVGQTGLGTSGSSDGTETDGTEGVSQEAVSRAEEPPVTESASAAPVSSSEGNEQPDKEQPGRSARANDGHSRHSGFGDSGATEDTGSRDDARSAQKVPGPPPRRPGGGGSGTASRQEASAKADEAADHDFRTQVRERLLAKRDEISFADLIPTTVPEAEAVVRDDGFAFLLAGALDRGMPAKRAWTLPYHLKTELGHLDPARIGEMSPDEIADVLGRLPEKPRYMRDAPHTVREVAHLVTERCDGVPERLWQDRPVGDVKRDLESITGVGPGIGSMIVLLLERCYGAHFADKSAMQVKPDVHVQRVLYRLGLSEARSEASALTAAQALSPEHPGAVDAPLWMVGQHWCTEKAPACESCWLGDLCSRVGVG